MTMTAFHGLRRFLVALCAVSIAVVIGSQAIAQSEAPVSAPSDAVEGTDSPTPAEPGVEQLFVLLKDAKTSQDAKGVAGRIAKVWLTSGSDTVDLLMERALIAVHAENYALALDLLDAVVLLKPDYTEGWNKRATVHGTSAPRCISCARTMAARSPTFMRRCCANRATSARSTGLP